MRRCNLLDSKLRNTSVGYLTNCRTDCEYVFQLELKLEKQCFKISTQYCIYLVEFWRIFCTNICFMFQLSMTFQNCTAIQIVPYAIDPYKLVPLTIFWNFYGICGRPISITFCVSLQKLFEYLSEMWKEKWQTLSQLSFILK